MFCCVAFSLNLSFGQGSVNFNNRGLRGPQGFYDAPVRLPNGIFASGPEYTAGLFLVGGDGSLNMVATSPFRTGAASGFFQPQNLVVPGTVPGSPATFRVRVWESAAGSYENAIATSRLYGEFPTQNPNNNIIVPRMAHVDVPEESPTLDGMLPLTLVPEPSPFSILTLAGSIWFVARSGRRSTKFA